MIKKILLITTGLLGLLLLVLVIFAMIIFRNPTLVINPSNLDWALTKSKVLNEWSWTDSNIEINWMSWRKRHLKGHFTNLCFDYKSEAADVKSCIENISWDFDLSWKYLEGFSYDIRNAFTVSSSSTSVKLHDPKDQAEPANDEKFIPPDIRDYWSMLWSGLVPDLIINFNKIEIFKADKELATFDISVLKTKTDLAITSYGVTLNATKDLIEVRGPKKFKIPVELKTAKPLNLTAIVLRIEMDKNPIAVKLTSELDKVALKVEAKVRFPMKEDYLREIIKSVTASVEIPKLNEALISYMFPPFNVLPAPLNSLEGPLNLDFHFTDGERENEVVGQLLAEMNLVGEKQALHFEVKGNAPFVIEPFDLGAIDVSLDIKKVALLLPRISKTSLPPQLMPDSRIQVQVPEVKKEEAEKAGPPIAFKLNLEALGDDTLSIATNLLDEPARLNFDLAIGAEGVSKGYVKLLPLNTSIFKRKIQVREFDITFNAPEEPEILSKILFSLPEYKITLNLDGPISNPRYFFSSDPLLPLDDIYAVLLFGRPLLDLNPDDKNSASQTNRLLSQGILSLSVLYFFAGSPVESIGYDPSSNEISAQFGLTEKSSLRVGGTQEGGFSSAGVRRSLGKGWYLDTSVQKTSTPTSNNVNDYGVLLERIIAY